MNYTEAHERLGHIRVTDDRDLAALDSIRGVLGQQARAIDAARDLIVDAETMILATDWLDAANEWLRAVSNEGETP